MKLITNLDRLLNSADYLPHLSINCVVFGFCDNRLKVLLPKLKGVDLHILPVSYVLMEEGMEEAAQMILRERTGLQNIFLEQFGAFGPPEHRDVAILLEFFLKNDISISPDHWILRRLISIGYYALVNASQVTPGVGAFDDSCTWHDVQELPYMSFDHANIIKKALNTLRVALDHKVVGFKLLPEVFTMKQLRTLHETILGHTLRRENFQRKMLGMGILQRVEKKFAGAANKMPYLYRFRGGT